MQFHDRIRDLQLLIMDLYILLSSLGKIVSSFTFIVRGVILDGPSITTKRLTRRTQGNELRMYPLDFSINVTHRTFMSNCP